MKELLFIIPMKDPCLGKSRLSTVLPAKARARLAVALFRQMLGFLQDKGDVLVVTGAAQVVDIATHYGAQTLVEIGEPGLSGAVTQAANWADAHGYQAICVLPADLADPDANDLDKLLQLPRGLVLAPAHDGGTNCLIVSPPTAISFHYGPNSCKAHQAQAVSQGISCTIAPLDSFAYDIDTSDDLARLVGKAATLWA